MPWMSSATGVVLASTTDAAIPRVPLTRMFHAAHSPST